MAATITHYENLANAIVVQAIQDYKAAKKALRKNPNNIMAKREIADVERFFRSKWYRVLTGVDASWLMGRIDQTLDSNRKINAKGRTVNSL